MYARSVALDAQEGALAAMMHHRTAAHDIEADALVEAIRALAADGLDPLDLALRFEQYECCALGGRCFEVTFDPVARRLVAHAARLRTAPGSLAWSRWERRVRALFAELRATPTETPVRNAARVAHAASRSATAKGSQNASTARYARCEG